MIEVVTSCSRKGWDAYGAAFVDSFLRYWPREVALLVVSEDRLIVPRQASYLNLIEHSVEAREFLDRHKDHSWAKGEQIQMKARGAVAGPYSLNHDAYKFCKKVFAVGLAAEGIGRGKLLWLDADVVTFTSVPIELVSVLLPDNVALSCLERPHLYSETGFVGYNLDHPECLPFIRDYVELYASDMIFQLTTGWHDCWAFDHVRKKRKTSTHSIPHSSMSHPFINSELGKYMDHCKGPRKQRGRSAPKEQLVHRNVGYWR